MSVHVPERELDYELLRLFDEHGKKEGSLLESYRMAAESASDDEGVQYLVSMILEDEHRHHRFFEEMANAVRSFLWELDVEPSTPSVGVGRNDELLAATKALIEFEKDDLKELKALRRTLKRARSTTLDPLLVELMIRDTQKHLAILEYLRSRLARR